MAKQGMSRPERTHTQPHNDAPPSPSSRARLSTPRKRPIPLWQAPPAPQCWFTMSVRFPLTHTPSWTPIWRGITWRMTSLLLIWKIYSPEPPLSWGGFLWTISNYSTVAVIGYSTVFGRGGSTVEPDKSVTMYATVCRSCASQLLVCDHCTNQAVVVHAGNALCFCPGCQVCIHYNGVMTHSIPPQISATCIHAMG